MTTTVYVPLDSSARAVGADEVAVALTAEAARRGDDIRIVRNGSRGMLWLEPFIEVEVDGTRVGYGPVRASDVTGLLDAGLLTGADHPLAHGPVDQLEWLTRQDRLTYARMGVVDPIDLDDYEAHGGLVGLRQAIAMTPQQVVDTVTASGLRGRGGAGFPAGRKWQTVLDAVPAQGGIKYICCNADEGDSGTFADRMLMEGDPFTLLEGMTIAALAVGATQGFIYLRSEYPDAGEILRAAIGVARDAGWLGADVLGSGRAFDIDVRMGAGAYICGEETSMLDSLEGKRGMVRAKPPLPALEGLFGQPTVVNNVLTLGSVPFVLAEGADAYASRGLDRSLGTQVFQLAGNIKQGGVVELGFGVTLRELVDDFGGGTASGRPVRAIQVGGPLGAYLSAEQLDLPLEYETFAAAGAMVGHGGIVVHDDTVDMARMARFAMEFCSEESCGKCTPCRIGSTRGVEVIDRIRAGDDRPGNLTLLLDLCDTMVGGSLCAMGSLTPMPVKSALTKFPEDFGLTAEEVLS
jgi:formate dehydrogenase iron-sulfur subunit